MQASKIIIFIGKLFNCRNNSYSINGQYELNSASDLYNQLENRSFTLIPKNYINVRQATAR